MNSPLSAASLILSFLPLLTFSCPVEFFSCQGNYDNTSVTRCGTHFVQCKNSVLKVRFLGRGHWYEMRNITFPEKTFKVLDPWLGSRLQHQDCHFLYNFTNPIHGFYPSTENVQLFSNHTLFNCNTNSYDFSRDLFEMRYGCSHCLGYDLYCTKNPGRQRFKSFHNCSSTTNESLVEWKLSFTESKEGTDTNVEFSLLSLAFTHGRLASPRCFACVLNKGNCRAVASASSSDCSCNLECRIGRGLNMKKKVIIVVCGSILGAIVATVIATLFVRRPQKSEQRNTSPHQASLEDFLVAQGPLGVTRCSYRELKKMTNNFSTRLGSGGYGSVYKGDFHNGGKNSIPVAVKLLSESKGSSGQDFINEVASIGRTNHVNVVSLLGFCLDGSRRALIYEFMPNGSLDRFIFCNDNDLNGAAGTPLGWEQLYRIALGIAKGLEYLHKRCRNRVVHFDIKPHNIPLDEDFCPKISDFGLAKLCPDQGSVLSMECARGTIGYIAPELVSRSLGPVSSKSDVYSYGMMMLEMVGGRRNFDSRVEKSSEMYFPHWAYKHLVEENDLRACGVTAESNRVATKMVIVGLWCIQTNPSHRPSINRVVEMLEGEVEDLEIPPKPYLSSSA